VNNSDYLQAEFENTLFIIQSESIGKFDSPPFDWDAYRTHVLQQTGPIHTVKDFFGALDVALKSLGDSHSYTVSPDVIAKMENNPNAFKQDNPTIEVKEGIGIITIPTHYQIDPHDPHSVKWVEEFHKSFSIEAKSVTKGWVIDLIENTGGDLNPMIGALGPLFTNKDLGGFYCLDDNHEIMKNKITYEMGEIKFSEAGDSFTLHYPYFHIDSDNLPITVLIGSQTASSGEFLALALQHQPNTMILGEPTFGLATVNAQMDLPEKIGGYYLLTVGFALDKNDEPLKTMKVFPDKEMLGSKSDLLNAAIDYLNTQPILDLTCNANVLKFNDVISDEHHDVPTSLGSAEIAKSVHPPFLNVLPTLEFLNESEF
jgi:carboxyl-terminal processing protease